MDELKYKTKHILRGLYAERENLGPHKTHTEMFTAALFTVALNWKQH